MTNEAVCDIAERLYKQEKRYRTLQAERSALKRMIAEALDERKIDTMLAGKYTITRTSYTRQQFDSKALAEYDEEAYKAFLRPVTVSKLEITR